MSKKSKDIATISIIFAIITIFCLVPLQIGPVSLAVLMLIPVLVACQTQSLLLAICAGTYMGILSLVASFTVSTSLLRFVFQNPLVSVLPRVVVGILTCLIYKGCIKLFKKVKNEKYRIMLSSAIASFFGVLINTTLVLGIIFGLYQGTSFSGLVITSELIWTIVTSNSILELCVCTLLTPNIVYGLHRAKLGNIKAI